MSLTSSIFNFYNWTTYMKKYLFLIVLSSNLITLTSTFILTDFYKNQSLSKKNDGVTDSKNNKLEDKPYPTEEDNEFPEEDNEFPKELDIAFYKQQNPQLTGASDLDVRLHFANTGIKEGDGDHLVVLERIYLVILILSRIH